MAADLTRQAEPPDGFTTAYVAPTAPSAGQAEPPAGFTDQAAAPEPVRGMEQLGGEAPAAGTPPAVPGLNSPEYVNHRRVGAYKQTPEQEKAIEGGIAQWPVSKTGGMPDLEEYGNTALVAGGELLPAAMGAVKIPAVQKALYGASVAVNGYFAAMMAKGAGQHVKEAADLYNKGDYVGMAARLGHAGVEGLLAYTGIKNFAKTAVIPRPGASPNPAYDMRGPVDPSEVQQGGGIPAPEPPPAAAAEAPPIDVTAGQAEPPAGFTTAGPTAETPAAAPVRVEDLPNEWAKPPAAVDPLKRMKGEKYSVWQARVKAAQPAPPMPSDLLPTPEQANVATTQAAQQFVTQQIQEINNQHAATVEQPAAPAVQENPVQGQEIAAVPAVERPVSQPQQSEQPAADADAKGALLEGQAPKITVERKDDGFTVTAHKDGQEVEHSQHSHPGKTPEELYDLGLAVAEQRAKDHGIDPSFIEMRQPPEAGPEEEPAPVKEPWQMTADQFIAFKGIKAGRREIQQAHNEHSAAVHAAVEAGKDVPANVLAEYPGAAAKAPKQTKAKIVPKRTEGGGIQYVAEPVHEEPPAAPQPLNSGPEAKPETPAEIKPTAPEPAPEEAKAGYGALIDAVHKKLTAGESLGNMADLTRMAIKAFGGERTSGQWTPKDAYDAMEAGINKHLLDRGKDLMAMDPIEALKELRGLMGRITTQGIRTYEQIKKQQFSTPPTESYVAARVANIKPEDTVLEPSAGNGGLAVWPKAIGAKVHVNEIAERRQKMLEEVGFGKPTAHDGEYINALLDPEIKPTVVLMNPPFSAATATKGDMAKNKSQYGFNHVEQALQRLAPGGRLVAILGGGQANEPMGGATIKPGGVSGKWFDKIASKYNVRANIRVEGKEYAKYGTSFATRIIVIDKTPPVGGANWRQHVVVDNVATLEEAYNLLKDVEADRPAIAAGGTTTTVPARPESKVPSGPEQSGTRVGAGPQSSGPGNSRPTQESGGAQTGVPSGDVEPVRQPAKGTEQSQPESGAEPPARVEGPAVSSAPNNDAATPNGPESSSPGNEQPAVGSTDAKASVDERIALENAEHEHVSDEEDSTGYVTYRPSIKGKAHPGSVVETKTMATVPLPKFTYQPHAKVMASKWLSAVQLEAVAMAGQQNSIVLPGGFRAAALIGDGTGLGKGSEAAAILWDNFLQGRKRIVMVSQNWDLMNAFMGDLNDVGAADDLLRGLSKQPNGKWGVGKGAKTGGGVRPLNDWDANEKIDHKGIVFSTYGTMRGGDKKGNRRISQIEEYLKGDDDGTGGYILFDESHNLKNAVPGPQGAASQVGIAAKELLERMPNLRSVSLSATAASEVRNLGYLDRLGLWGPGTAFPDGFREFQSEIADGGLAAMELIAREMKALGKYLARTLSFRGVTYETVKHELNPDQKAIYNTAATAWATVSQSVEATIRHTTNGGGAQTARFMSAFYGAQLRFFSILITTLKIPTAIETANKALADDKAVVITLVNTNEAAQNREKAKAPTPGEEDEEDLTEFDFGPKEILVNLVRKSYPTQQYEDKIDAEGKPYKSPMYMPDPHNPGGKELPVQNPQAVAERDALIAQIEADLHLPDNPLDILINSLGGHDKVAELTGRGEYFDRGTNKFIKRAGNGISHKDVNLVEAKNFQDGKKEVAVLSSAAGTGISLHAGLNVKNQKQRVHITLQVGWQADKAQQMLGRTHRTNQASPPHYIFLISDLGGEQRFVATIQQRLESLGALSKGQKDAASSGSAAEFNPLSAEGKSASNGFYTALLQDQPVPGTGGRTGMSILQQMKVLKVVDGTLTVPEEDRTNVARLMNRVLAMDPDLQNGVFNYFAQFYGEAVKNAIERGTLDTGVKTLPGDEFTFGKPELLATDKDTSAQTWYYPITAKVKLARASLASLKSELKHKKDDHPQVFVNISQGKKKGNLLFAIDAQPHVTEDGKIIPARYVMGPGNLKYTKVDESALRNGAMEVGNWATKQVMDASEQLEKAKGDLDSDEKYGYNDAKREFRRLRDVDIPRDERYVTQKKETLASAEESYQRVKNDGDPQVTGYAKQRIDEVRALLEHSERQLAESQGRLEAMGDPFSEARAKVTEAETALTTAEAIAKDPMKWVYEKWKEQHDAAPDHVFVEHHLIGGAVMRYWNALKKAAYIQHSIYTATETKTGNRVVGVDIPEGRIAQLKARISGGASMVDAGQLHTDVLRNATRYTLEGNIQVQRGSVSRTPVIQLIPPNEAVARNLVRMGVMQERGISPIFYVPNVMGKLKDKNGPAVASTFDILRSILEAYPAEVNKAPNSGGPTGSTTYGSGLGALQPGLEAIYRGAVKYLTAQRAARQAQAAEPLTDYSGMGALEDKTVRNLSQLRRADEPSHGAAVKMAVSRAQSAVLLRVAAPRIEAALGKHVSWLDFRRALIQSRLMGIRARWDDMAQAAATASDADLDTAMGSWMYHLLDKLHYQPKDPAMTAAALLGRGDYDTLRMVLEDQFDQAAGNTASMMPDAEYRAITSAPTFAAGLKIYKRLVESSIAANHAENEGVFSDALGPLDTYYPLIAILPADQIRAQAAAGVAYRKPKNMQSNFAGGQSKLGYDPGMTAMAERIRSAFRTNNKAALIQALLDAKLLRKLGRDEDPDPEMDWQGRTYKAVVVPMGEARTLITPSKTIHIPAMRALVPEWLESELAPILDKKSLELYKPGSLLGKITEITLVGPTDFVYHSSNLIATIAARSPFMGDTMAGHVIGAIPFVKRVAASWNVWRIDASTDEAAADLIQMAKLGLIPERFASTTYSKKFAEQTGAEHVPLGGYGLKWGPTLYGPNGIDVRARLFLYRLQKKMNPGATAAEQYLFVNQLGNYTRALQGSWERGLKDTIFSPFATAGMTMNRNGINTILGTGPQYKERAWWKNITAGDALKLVAVWALLHKAYRHKWPWEEKDSKLLKIKLLPKHQHSAVGKIMGGDKGDVFVNMGFGSPQVGRGARALGIQGAYNTAVAKGSTDQVMEAALTDAINSALSPVLGPPAKFAWLGITGTEPYLTGLRDPAGRPGPQFFPAVKPQKPGLSGFLKQHAGAPIINMNSLVANVGEATGMTKGIMREESAGGTGWTKAGRVGINLAAPQLVDRPVKPGGKAGFLAHQRRSLKLSK